MVYFDGEHLYLSGSRVWEKLGAGKPDKHRNATHTFTKPPIRLGGLLQTHVNVSLSTQPLCGAG